MSNLHDNSVAETVEQLQFQVGRRAPFAQVGDWVLLAAVRAPAKTLYWALSAHINASRDDTVVWPTQDMLAEILGLRRGDKVKTYLDELVNINAVEVRKSRRYSTGMRERSTYIVHQSPPSGFTGLGSLQEFYTERKARIDAEAKQDPNPQFTPAPPFEGTGSGDLNPQVTRAPSNGGAAVPPNEGAAAPPNRGTATTSNGGSNHTNQNHTKLNQTNTQLTNQPQPAAVQTADGDMVPSQAGWVVGTSSTEPTRTSFGGSPGEQLLASLSPPWLFGRRAIVELGPRVTTFLANGWTEAALTERWTVDRASKPLGALRYRIDDTPDWPDTGQVYLVLPDACAECLDESPGARTNPEMRRRYDESVGCIVRCRACHPELVQLPSTTPQGALV